MVVFSKTRLVFLIAFSCGLLALRNINQSPIVVTSPTNEVLQSQEQNLSTAHRSARQTKLLIPTRTSSPEEEEELVLDLDATAAPTPFSVENHKKTVQQEKDDDADERPKLSPVDELYLTSTQAIPPGFIATSSGIQATVTEETMRGAISKTTNRVSELQAKYCKCQRYLGLVPDKGSRLGHFLNNWMKAHAMARLYNLTLLYHPITPNQPERFLFERFFGFGYNEPYRYYETCVTGEVGLPCKTYLGCLKVEKVKEKVKEMSSEDYFRNLVKKHKDECNVLFEIPANFRHYALSKRVVAELAHKYQFAREVNPMDTIYTDDKIHVAVHMRRGDVVDSQNEAGRITNESVVKEIITSLIQQLHEHSVHFHLFSQGTKLDFPQLDELENNGILTFHLNTPLLQTFNSMVEADIFVAAKSGFSDAVARLRPTELVTLYPSDSWNDKMDSWILFNNDAGSFNTKTFQTKFTQALKFRESL